jgi:hypothetical protein
MREHYDIFLILRINFFNELKCKLSAVLIIDTTIYNIFSFKIILSPAKLEHVR